MAQNQSKNVSKLYRQLDRTKSKVLLACSHFKTMKSGALSVLAIGISLFAAYYSREQSKSPYISARLTSLLSVAVALDAYSHDPHVQKLDWDESRNIDSKIALPIFFYGTDEMIEIMRRFVKKFEEAQAFLKNNPPYDGRLELVKYSSNGNNGIECHHENARANELCETALDLAFGTRVDHEGFRPLAQKLLGLLMEVPRKGLALEDVRPL